jgi:hypothetical protein
MPLRAGIVAGEPIGVRSVPRHDIQTAPPRPLVPRSGGREHNDPVTSRHTLSPNGRQISRNSGHLLPTASNPGIHPRTVTSAHLALYFFFRSCGPSSFMYSTGPAQGSDHVVSSSKAVVPSVSPWVRSIETR